MRFLLRTALFIALFSSERAYSKECGSLFLKSLINKPSTYLSELRKEGSKRFFIKDGRSNFTKLSWNPLYPGKELKAIDYLNPQTLFQLPVRKLTKLVSGAPYEFEPAAVLERKIEQFIIQSIAKDSTKTLTTPTRFILASVTFPITGLGITSGLIYSKYNQHMRMAKRDFLIQFDYRYNDANEKSELILKTLNAHPEQVSEFLKQTHLSSLEKKELENLGVANENKERFYLSDLMSTLSGGGFDYKDAVVLSLLNGNEDAIHEVSKRLSQELLTKKSHYKQIPEKNTEPLIESNPQEILELQLTHETNILGNTLFTNARTYTSDSWRKNPPENIVVDPKSIITEAQKRKVYKIQLDLILAEEELYANTSRSHRVIRYIQNQLSRGAPGSYTSELQNYLNDPFITETLPRLASQGKTDRSLIPYHASQFLEAVANEKMLEAIQAKQLAYEYDHTSANGLQVKLSNHFLTIDQIKDEILKDNENPNSVPQKYIEYKKWKKLKN